MMKLIYIQKLEEQDRRHAEGSELKTLVGLTEKYTPVRGKKKIYIYIYIQIV